MVNNVILFLLLIFAVRYDLVERKIPNFLTVPVVIWGVLSGAFINGVQGLLYSVFGFIVGMAIFFIPFALGGMGAGDVKLMGAIGAIMGWVFIIRTALFTALAGGLIVIIYSLYTGKLLRILKSTLRLIIRPMLWLLYITTNNAKIFARYSAIKETDKDDDRLFIPYGLAIGIGALLVMSERYIG